MKKCAIALLFSLGMFKAAYSQDKVVITDQDDESEQTDSSLNPRFGLKANFIGAYNTAHFNGTANSSMSNKYGVGFGAFLDIPFTKTWGMQVGLNYAALGSKITGYYFNITYAAKQTLKYNYVTIPLVAKYNIGQSGVTVLAGPQFGILVSAKRIDGSDNKTDVKSDLKSNDISALGGVEYKLPLNHFSPAVKIGASYQAGLTNIIKTLSDNSNNKMYNNAFSVYASITF